MKQFWYGVLLTSIFVLLTMSMEEPMAKLMDEDKRKGTALKAPSNEPPAWMGRMNKAKNAPEEEGKGFGGMRAGAGAGQALPAAVLNARNPNIGRPADAAYFENQLRLTDANRRAAVMDEVSARDDMRPLYRPPAYGGTYNPTSPFATSRPLNRPIADEAAARRGDTYDSYSGQPVNYSYSDLLRSLMPITLGSGDANTSYSDTLRTVAAGTPLANLSMTRPTYKPTSGGGNGYGYGNNYRRGGGGGGFGSSYSGWGGGDYYDNYSNTPAWLNAYLRLNNWNIG